MGTAIINNAARANTPTTDAFLEFLWKDDASKSMLALQRVLGAESIVLSYTAYMDKKRELKERQLAESDGAVVEDLGLTVDNGTQDCDGAIDCEKKAKKQRIILPQEEDMTLPLFND